MQAVAAEQELFRACEIIFGPGLNVSREFLEYLQLSGIKTAYRKRAMETHPDRMASQGEIFAAQGHDLFQVVQEAYENLTNYLDARDRGYRLPQQARSPFSQPAPPRRQPPRPRPKAQPKRRAQNNHARQQQHWQSRSQQQAHQKRNTGFGQQQKSQTQTDGFGQRHEKKSTIFTQASSFWDIEKLYQGPMPNRRLMLGHFLYYSGIINWRTIIQALIWQRMERPRLGELGHRFGMLSEEEILHILQNRPPMKPFGETALDMGLLTEPQLKMLVFHQKRLQKKFGEFFVEKKILQPEELRMLLNKYQQHNAQIITSQAEQFANM